MEPRKYTGNESTVQNRGQVAPHGRKSRASTGAAGRESRDGMRTLIWSVVFLLVIVGLVLFFRFEGDVVPLLGGNAGGRQ